MEDHSKSVMIALLPVTSDWCKIELPHLTLVYCGEIDDLSPSDYNELGKEVLDLSRRHPPLALDVVGIDIFGSDDDPVDVLKLQATPELLSMRASVERWNASEYDFTPHATVGPIGSIAGNIPNRLLFDRVHLGWGDTGFNCKLVPSV